MRINDYIAELRTLVNLDSGTASVAGVAAVASVLQARFLSMGWHARLVDLGAEVGPGLVATNRADAAQFDAMLLGHMDTVFPEGTARRRPFSVDGDLARGPGVADMKSGLLSAIYALSALEAPDLNRLSICVVLNPDEEVGSPCSSEWVVSHARRSRCVLDFEPARPDGSLVKARKGVCGYKLDFRGVAAHSGNDPRRGRSAIVEMAHWISDLTNFNDYEAGTSVNIGTVAGGTARNIVPDHACATLEFRSWRTEALTRIEARMSEMQRQPFTPDVTVHLRRESQRPPMEASAQTELLMRKVEAAGRENGLEITWKAAGGGSDACNTANAGVPSLDGFGPVGGSFHEEGEYLRLDSVVPRVRLVTRLLQLL